MCALLIVVPLLLLTGMAWSARADWPACWRALREVSAGAGYLLAAGVGVLLMPPVSNDLVILTLRDLWRWQAGALLVGWWVALLAVSSAACLALSHEGRAGVGAAALGIVGCAALMPFFFRTPRRALLAVALLVSAIGVSVLKYAA